MVSYMSLKIYVKIWPFLHPLAKTSMIVCKDVGLDLLILAYHLNCSDSILIIILGLIYLPFFAMCCLYSWTIEHTEV